MILCSLFVYALSKRAFPLPPLVKGSIASQSSQTLTPNPKEIAESMEIDNDGNSIPGTQKSFSVPRFLRKVFMRELVNDDGRNHKLLVIAVHAVLMESGFLEIDPVSNALKVDNNVGVEPNWHLASFYYTIPNLITTANIETVKIKFQILGNYCKVYGSLVNEISHSVLLDEDKLVPFLNIVWANGGQMVETLGDDNHEVLEFWRRTKDELALPLLIDLCQKTGLQLPPCFMQLPIELKLKILDALSGVEIAKVSCVCTDLRSLASNDDLWKRKYVAQFGNYEGSGSERGFKERFAKAWGGRKNILNFDLFGTEVVGGDPDEWAYMARDCLLRIRGS